MYVKVFFFKANNIPNLKTLLKNTFTGIYN